MNWKEMKEFCNSLSEEQLLKTVSLWKEEETLFSVEAKILEDDYYIDKENDYEGYIKLSDTNDAERFGLEKVYSAGDAILYED